MTESATPTRTEPATTSSPTPGNGPLQVRTGTDAGTGSGAISLPTRRRALVVEGGYRVWRRQEETVTLVPEKTALVLCDVWDHHTCRGAEERLERLLPRMSEVVETLRARGALIVHAPSDTMPNYEGVPARQRAQAAPRVEPPTEIPHDTPPLPVDAKDGGCDTLTDEAHPHVDWDPSIPYPWKYEHPAIHIDQERDVISADGRELLGVYHQRGIEHVLLMGVHTNMCILNRSFSIKQMVRWGFPITLLRDLTDTMYNPASPPYVSHEEGTRLVVEFIESHWTQTATSDALLAALAQAQN